MMIGQPMMLKSFAPTAAAAFAVALAAGAGQTAQPAGAVIHIANFAFGPQVVSVASGATVTWVNDDDDAHSIVADNGLFHSSAMDTADRYSFTFKTPGAYAYHCGLHPHMVAKIVVRP
jgi:plastocyanin